MKQFLLFVFCTTTFFAQAQNKNENAIRAMLSAQEAAWNTGNLEQFMIGYWQSDSLMFIGKNGPTYGYDKTLEGKLKKATGFAKVKAPGKLKVYFFWPFGGDYWILDLDTVGYQYALIGTPDKNYLWILSRTPQMNNDIYQTLVNKAKSLGFNTTKLLTVDQPKAN